MSEIRTFNVMIAGHDIPQPVDFLVDLPEWLTKLATGTDGMADLTGVEKAAQIVLAERFATLYMGITSDLDVPITWDNITLRG